MGEQLAESDNQTDTEENCEGKVESPSTPHRSRFRNGQVFRAQQASEKISHRQSGPYRPKAGSRPDQSIEPERCTSITARCREDRLEMNTHVRKRRASRLNALPAWLGDIARQATIDIGVVREIVEGRIPVQAERLAVEDE